MEYKRLCESDYRLMTVIWDEEPVNSTELVVCCKERLGWKKSTTYTMLRKLCQKGLAKNENATVTALVKREEVQAAESETFVEQTFGGSLPAFLVSFLGGKTLSEREVRELNELIEQHKEE